MSLSDDCVRVCEGIEVSAQDDRQYRCFTLENKLQVLVVSHPDTDKASAAMDVRVGHLCDPDDVAGLAHFLEHMLFLGTEKYPDENSYSQYLSSHGGRSNAFTSATDTNYYFDVAAPFLEEALDRFAQFFIAPLFTPSATEREMNAVDSENAKNLQNDYWRFNQLYKHFARKDHPYHKFGTGNLFTLDEYPRSKGIDIRKELLEFHQTYYSASIMKLVVYGREDVDTLQAMVERMFSTIRNTDRSIPAFEGSPFSQQLKGLRVDVAPVKDLRIIEIVWPIPPVRTLYREKPYQYVSHLIGHEGRGSLLSLLKARGWANELSAGVSKDEDRWALFSVTIEATKAGVEHHVDDVVGLVYQYLAMLKQHGPKEWIFDEIRHVSNMNFRFRNKEAPISYVSSLASRLHTYPPVHVVSGPLLLRRFESRYVTDLLDRLVPSNMRLMVVSTTFAGQTQSVEKWYDTPYTQSWIADDVLQHWAEVNDDVDPSQMRLPVQNELISTDFDLIVPAVTRTVPVLSHDAEQYRVWYKYDNVFEKPKLNVFLNIVTPQAYASPRLAVLTDVYVECVHDALTECTYDAEIAGLKYVLKHTMKGFELYTAGYSHKLPILVRRVVQCLRRLPKLEQSVFDRVQDKTRRAYANFAQEQPYQHAAYDANYMLENARWHNADKLKALDAMTREEVVSHGDALFASVFVEALAHGNVTERSANEIVSHVVRDLDGSSIFTCELPCLRVAHLQAGHEYIYQAPEPNADNQNSAIQVLFQLGPHRLIQKAMLELLAQVLHEPCFSQLRTTEQLGYIVFSGAFHCEGIDHVRFIVQSDKMAPDGLDERIESFLRQFRTLLDEMDTERFNKYKAAVKSKLLEKPKTPWEETMRYWREISKNMYEFELNQKTAELVETLTRHSLVHFFETYMAVGGSKRAKFSCQIFGNQHPVPNAAACTDDDDDDATADLLVLAAVSLDDQQASASTKKVMVRNMDEFKRTIPLHPAQGLSLRSTKTTASRL